MGKVSWDKSRQIKFERYKYVINRWQVPYGLNTITTISKLIELIDLS